jgi:hypothetical protein
MVVYGMDAQVGQSLDSHSFMVCLEICLCSSFQGYLVPYSKKEKSIQTLVFLLLFEFHVFYKLYLGYLSFWANIHLSVSAYHFLNTEKAHEVGWKGVEVQERNWERKG